MRKVMLLTVAVLSVGLSCSAYAVDLVTPIIFSSGDSCCVAVNANPTVGDITVRIRILNLNNTLLTETGNITIAPGHAGGDLCLSFSQYHYCRITTSNGPATRGNLQSLDAVTRNPTASVDAR